MSIGLLYIGLLVVGVVYAFISGTLGWVSDLAGGDIHIDAGGHLDAGHAHPVSGTVLATFITGFGGGGIVGHYLLHWPLLGGLGLALGTGLVLAAAAFGILELIFSQTESGSEFTTGDLTGRDAEVITPIPADGSGEVAYLVKGQRETGPARSADGSAIPRGHPVVIEKVIGPTLFVREKR
jgi:membrane-bound ClpP family serine protease